MLFFALLAACAPCPEGLTRNADGVCAGADDGKLATGEGGDGIIEWSELYDSWPACDAKDPANDIDLNAGCVSGACIGDSLADLEATWGAGDCDGDECEWTTGIKADFDGNADDGGLVETLTVREPFAGADEDGLGIGVEIRCFAEKLGQADTATFSSEDGLYFPYGIFWHSPSVSVFDDDAILDSGDFRVDAIYLHGS